MSKRNARDRARVRRREKLAQESKEEREERLSKRNARDRARRAEKRRTVDEQ